MPTLKQYVNEAERRLQDDPEVREKEIRRRLEVAKHELNAAVHAMAILISVVPTSRRRNVITEANIHVMKAEAILASL
jgi:guanylate kinase